MKFGRLVWTNGINEKISRSTPFAKFITKALERYAMGDWGDLCEEDKLTNEKAIKYGDRVLAKYNYDEDNSIYIITEWDRSYTTILFTYEY